jgi:hypothetical protein
MFDDLEHNDNEELEFGPELSDKEQGELWEMIYEKISLAVLNNHNFAIMFNIVPKSENPDEGSSAIIEKSQFEILLSNYMKWCESKEMFERCSEVQKLLIKLKNYS